jgi:hypothetical protein
MATYTVEVSDAYRPHDDGTRERLLTIAGISHDDWDMGGPYLTADEAIALAHELLGAAGALKAVAHL